MKAKKTTKGDVTVRINPEIKLRLKEVCRECGFHLRDLEKELIEQAYTMWSNNMSSLNKEAIAHMKGLNGE